LTSNLPHLKRQVHRTVDPTARRNLKRKYHSPVRAKRLAHLLSRLQGLISEQNSHPRSVWEQLRESHADCGQPTECSSLGQLFSSGCTYGLPSSVPFPGGGLSTVSSRRSSDPECTIHHGGGGRWFCTPSQWACKGLPGLFL
jgi:hypothetical protein